jgi:pyruvate kinase
VVTPDLTRFNDMVEVATEAAINQGFASVDDSIVITAGVPFGTPNATNVLRIAKVN